MHVSFVILAIFGLRAIAIPLLSWENTLTVAPVEKWEGSVVKELNPIAPAMEASPTISLGEIVRWLPALRT